jgi:hypothetical protein
VKGLKLMAAVCTAAAFLAVQFPHGSRADGASSSPARQESIRITKNKPKFLTTKEKKLPMQTGTKILLGVLGAAVVAGAVAAGLGGGGGDSGNPAGDTPQGSITIGW